MFHNENQWQAAPQMAAPQTSPEANGQVWFDPNADAQPTEVGVVAPNMMQPGAAKAAGNVAAASSFSDSSADSGHPNGPCGPVGCCIGVCCGICGLIVVLFLVCFCSMMFCNCGTITVNVDGKGYMEFDASTESQKLRCRYEGEMNGDNNPNGEGWLKCIGKDDPLKGYLAIYSDTWENGEISEGTFEQTSDILTGSRTMLVSYSGDLEGVARLDLADKSFEIFPEGTGESRWVSVEDTKLTKVLKDGSKGDAFAQSVWSVLEDVVDDDDDKSALLSAHYEGESEKAVPHGKGVLAFGGSLEGSPAAIIDAEWEKGSIRTGSRGTLHDKRRNVKVEGILKGYFLKGVKAVDARVVDV